MNFKQILVELVEKKGSDLHLRVGLPPVIRLNGELTKLGSERTTVEDIDAALSTILTPDQLAKLKTNPELDLALSVSKLGRFRINIYRQRGTFSLALRTVNTDVPTFEQLNLPTVMKEIAESRRGLIIVTGTTGSGKSTTLAALIERINSTRAENILTIEDPIEYVYRDQLSIISQREIGGDTNSFTNALRAAFRQDPDVILVGEIRDYETAKIALQAALTGHLVLTTLHTNDAAGTIVRLQSLGEKPINIAPAINIAVAQRLVRRICKKCVKFSPPTEEELQIFKKELGVLGKKIKIPKLSKNLKIPRVQGCKFCNFTGYKGRIGIFEFFLKDDEMENFILKSPSITDLRKIARKKGMVLMREDGLIKVLQGMTTLEEIKRVTAS